MLKCRLYDHGDTATQVFFDQVKEEFRDPEVRVGRQFIVSYAEGVDETLLHLVANDHRHSQHLRKLARKRGLTGSLPAGDDSTAWFGRWVRQKCDGIMLQVFAFVYN
jgi:hypothetical protein